MSDVHHVLVSTESRLLARAPLPPWDLKLLLFTIMQQLNGSALAFQLLFSAGFLRSSQCRLTSGVSHPLEERLFQSSPSFPLQVLAPPAALTFDLSPIRLLLSITHSSHPTILSSVLGKMPSGKTRMQVKFASFLLQIIASQILPALGTLQFLPGVALYLLSRFCNYFGRKINLRQAIPLWPEPEALCSSQLLSPFQNCLRVGSKSFC